MDKWDSSLRHWSCRATGFCYVSRCTLTDFRTIFAFSSNEFVPDCLSASELWETINHVYFFAYVDKLLLTPPTSLCPDSSFCMPTSVGWWHIISKTISRQPHRIITDQLSNSIATYAIWAIQLCAVLQYQTLAEYNILAGFFFFFPRVCKSNKHSLSLKIWDYLFLLHFALIRLTSPQILQLLHFLNNLWFIKRTFWRIFSFLCKVCSDSL